MKYFDYRRFLMQYRHGRPNDGRGERRAVADVAAAHAIEYVGDSHFASIARHFCAIKPYRSAAGNVPYA